MTGTDHEDKIIIAGIGLTPVGEHWDLDLRTLSARAVRLAIRDSGGILPEGLFVGNVFAPILSHQSNLGAVIASECGLTGVETWTFEAGGASGAAAVRAAYLAVRSGMLDSALALGVEKITENTGSAAAQAQDLLLNYEYETMSGMTLPSGAALLARRYLHEYGLDREVLDCFSLGAYGQACGNPNALYHLQLDGNKLAGQSLANPPLGMFDCSALSDGAAALLITRESCLPKGYAHERVEILASASATDSLSLHDRHHLLYYGSCAASAEKAFHQRGISPAEMDLWELWDAFSIDAILAREAIGLSAPGLGWKFGGDYHCCMGGNLGRGNPLGASGAYQIAEATLQLRDEAGNCQISGARSAFTQAVGGLGATAVTHILRRAED